MLKMMFRNTCSDGKNVGFLGNDEWHASLVRLQFNAFQKR